MWLWLIPFILQAADAVTALVHPGHIVIYAPGDSLACRLPATRNYFGDTYFITGYWWSWLWWSRY
ncbi:hypothetical protein DMI69_02295 [Escherichia coli]|nr:hypothetical protein [Escherichia coli]